MKKSILTIALLGTFSLSSTASADTILGVYAGANVWNMETEGGFASNQNVANFSYEKEPQGSFYVALEHPIPLVPNIKISRTGMDTNGSTTLSSSFTFGGELYTADTSVLTDVDLSVTDFILYYEILDNDLVSIDIGVNGKVLDGSILVQELQGNRQASQELDSIIPMAYSRVAFGLPLTGLGAYAEGSFLSIDDQSLTDYQAAITYSFVESLALDLTLQLGYRATTLDIEDIDDVYADLEFSGIFAGMEFHF